jgi:hypothetical protein
MLIGRTASVPYMVLAFSKPVRILVNGITLTRSGKV